MPTSSVIASQAALCSSPIPSSSQATNSGQLTLQNACTQSSALVSHPAAVNSVASNAYSCYITPATVTAASGATICHRPLVGGLANINPTAFSHSQVGISRW